MTQEEKQLLLVDLSARLHYGVKVQGNFKWGFDGQIMDDIRESVLDIETLEWLMNGIEVRPYLRPMSSMTDEERKEYELLANHCIVTSIGFIHLEAAPLTDWLNAHHFDYRNLIEKGLAIAVTKDNNSYKE